MSDILLAELLAAVEQQLVSPETKYVPVTLQRLLHAGMEEGEAKRQIAYCLSEELFEITCKQRPFDQQAYRAALDALPLAPGDAAE